MTAKPATDEMVALKAELAQARETNRKLHRRAQRAEGVVQVLNDTLALWDKPPHRGGYGNYRFGYSVAVRFVKHYVEARLKRNAGKPPLDATEQRASSDVKVKGLDEQIARTLRILQRAEEGAGTLPAKSAVKLVPGDWHDLARAIRALQNGGGDA